MAHIWRNDATIYAQCGVATEILQSCAPPSRRRTTITYLPGHVVITDLSETGANETTVTLYIGLPLSATPLDPDNPIVPGDAATTLVQTAETTIEAALGIEVCEQLIVERWSCSVINDSYI